MKWHLMNPLQLRMHERLLTERLQDGPVAACPLLRDSVQADLDAINAARARREAGQQAVTRAAA